MNFLSLTNEILAKFNEVPLNSGNFNDVVSQEGVYADAKKAVNQAIEDIYTEGKYRWAFLRVNDESFTTVAYQTEYPFPLNYRAMDVHSFIVQPDADTRANKIHALDISNYRKYYLERDTNNAYNEHGNCPRFIVEFLDRSKFIISPPPDKAYTITYDYFQKPTTLVNFDDEPLIPVEYNNVIYLRALYYANLFRDNIEQAAFLKEQSNELIKKMKRSEQLTPQYIGIVSPW